MLYNTYKCLNCDAENVCKRNHYNKFCNNACQARYTFLQETLPKFLNGSTNVRRTQIKCLTHLKGYKCEECKNEGSHNGKILSLQLDHIDGDASNNAPNNVRLLCPNCHSQTDTFAAKNKGHGRQARGLKR